MQRSMILLDQFPWNEMDIDGCLKNEVQAPYWREVETQLRCDIYKGTYLTSDAVLTPYIKMPRPIENTGYGVEVEEETAVLDKTSSVVGHAYKNQFEDYEDLEKIKTPIITLNREKETEIIHMADMIFDGIIEYKMVGQNIHLGTWDRVAQWMGVENCYFALMDEPEFVHAILERLTDCMISYIEQMNELGAFDIYSMTCHCSHTFSRDLPSAACDKEHPLSYDAWSYGMAQLFTSVSPEVTEEFEVRYMQKVFPYFGAIYYGCCERLDDRLHMITKMPQIRKISCSPWSDRESFAEKLPKHIIMSNKPAPSLLAGAAMDEEEVRKDIRRTMMAAKANHVNVELILKDISTIRYEPQRLMTWSRIDPAYRKERKTLSAEGCFADTETVKEIEAYPWPDVKYCDFTDIYKQIDQHQDKMIFTGMWSPFFHDVAANEKFFAGLGDRADVMSFGNDFGTQLDLFVSPELFRKFILPSLKRIIAVGKKYNKLVMLHSCGSVYRIIPDLIDAQSFFVNATPQQIKDEVHRVRDILGPSIVISPSHEAILPNVPAANILAMAEAARD